MSLTIEETKNLIEVTQQVRELVVQITSNFIEVSTTENVIEITPVLNYLEHLQTKNYIEVSELRNFLEVSPVLSYLAVEDVRNYIEIADNITTLEILSVKNYIEVNNNPPNTDVDEAEIMFKKRTDFVSDILLYKGVASPGTGEGEAKWRISRITFDPNSNDDVDEDFAEGSDSFTNIWTNRAILNYG